MSHYHVTMYRNNSCGVVLRYLGRYDLSREEAEIVINRIVLGPGDHVSLLMTNQSLDEKDDWQPSNSCLSVRCGYYFADHEGGEMLCHLRPSDTCPVDG